MNSINWSDVFARAGKTFVQVFVTAMPVAAVIAVDLGAAQAAALSAGAAALSVVWNALLQWSSK